MFHLVTENEICFECFQIDVTTSHSQGVAYIPYNMSEKPMICQRTGL